jgi:Asp-tRNA(Asn)/Glu-tRNA(Gln) amidotransferase A subunit family amidase
MHRSTLRKMAEQVRAGRVSSRELIEAHLDRIEKVNPHLNAFSMLFAERARASADRADQGLKMGALHGVPVTVKDSFDVAGAATRLGSFFGSDEPVAEDSGVVARLRRAGAILLGKTNTPEFLRSYETDNYITGRTNNPWNVERTPGGSSGGEAAAIASGCSPGGVGSDGGGSIRVPAHFCGIAGLKPTPGRISMIGHRPFEASTGIGVAGPMARTVDDVKLLFEALAGFDDRDPLSAPVTARAAKIEQSCVGVFETFYGLPVDPSIASAVQGAAAALAGAGFNVEQFRPEGLERAPNVWSFFFAEIGARAALELIAGREAEAHWTYTENLARLAAKPQATAAETMEAWRTRDSMRRGLIEQMRKVPLLLMPVGSIVAFPHRHPAANLFKGFMPSTIFNLLGFPALAVPFAVDEAGLPVGVQLVARPWEEESLLELGIALEKARGEFPSPPEL